jgi:N-acetylgalactosamine-6-sulfatase
MAGQYQQRFGGLECAIGIGNVGRYDEAIWLQKRDELGLPPSAITMPRILKDGGYDTAIIGKWHLGYLPKFSPNRHGFDEFYGILGGNADYFTHKEESDLPCFYHNEPMFEENEGQFPA